MSPQHLRELSTFGWLQEGTGAAGMFFFSGAFWLAVTIFFEHNSELASYVPWLLLCGVSIIFGAVLIWIGWSHFNLKQARIRLLLEGKDPDEEQ